MIPIYTAPTTSHDQRTLLASYDDWKAVMPRLDQILSRVIEQEIYRNKAQKSQKLIRIEFSAPNAAKVLEAAQRG